MAQQTINHGTVAGDGTGESPFTGMQKINANFTELYSRMGTAESNINLKAPINNPTFTGTVNGITKAMVSLSNVDNVADANKPVSSAQAAAIAAGDNLRLKVNDVYNDFVITGLTTPVPVNSLDGTLSVGSAYVDGIRTTLGSASTYTYLALRDTYVDIDSAGAIYRSPVVNGNAEPSLTAGRLRLEKVVTDGSKITTVTAMAPRIAKGHPATFATSASGNPVLVTIPGQPYLPLRAPDSAPLPLIQRAWERMPFVARSQLIAAGGMPGVPKLFSIFSAVLPNGTDATALTNAITAAAATATSGHPGVVLIRENMTIDIAVTVSSEVAIVSDNGASISGAGSLIMSSYSELRGLDLAVRVELVSATATSRVRIIGNRFTYAGQQIYDSGTSNNSPHCYTQILWNEFVGGAGRYGLYFTYLARAKIQFNWYHAAYGEGRGLYGLNLDKSLVQFNHIDGAIVGLGILFERSKARRCNETTISQNLVENVSEEGISVDCYGNDVAKMSCVDRLTVGSTSGTPASNPSIICPRTTPNETTGITAGVYVVVLTGTYAGLVVRTNYIAASGTGNVRLQFANNTITAAQLAAMVGESVSIQYVADRWSIEENYLSNCAASIVSWGMLCNSQIARNVIDSPTGRSSIRVSSLGGLNPSSAIMAAGGCFSASPGVTVASNRIINNNAGAQIIYEGRSYGTELNTTPYIDALPSLCGDNSEDAVVTAWTNGTWTATLGAAALTSIGAANLDVDVFRHSIDLPDMGMGDWLSGATSGVARLNGNGVAVAFTIPHGLEIVPKNAWWSAMSTDARGDAAITVNASNITLTYAAAPASGTANVVVSWSAEA